MGDHTEAIQIDFDPNQISYEEIIDMVWEAHNPTFPAWSRQYMSAIWYENEAQREIIEAAKEAQARHYSQEIKTPILPLETFYRAEDYHQKYSLQKYRALMKPFHAMYPNFEGFVDSTAAARLNGFVSSRGTVEQLKEEVDGYGIPLETLKSVLRF